MFHMEKLLWIAPSTSSFKRRQQEVSLSWNVYVNPSEFFKPMLARFEFTDGFLSMNIKMRFCELWILQYTCKTLKLL